MKRIDLIEVEHKRKIGETCEYIEPNVTEDSIFYVDGEPIGFYLNKMPEKMCKLADLANAEFKSKNVPKSMLNRASAINQQSAREDIKEKYKDKKGSEVSQMCALLGSIPPKPMVRRPYPTISSVHRSEKAQTFIKAMLLLARESEKLIKEILPKQYEHQVELFTDVPEKWRFGNLVLINTVNTILCSAVPSETQSD